MKEGTISRLLDYYSRESIFRNEAARALTEFFNIAPGGPFKNERDEGDFNEWFVFDFRLLNGKTPLCDFYERNPLNLPEDERKIYREIRNNEFGLWKVLKIEKDKGLELKNIRSGNKYFVSEKTGTHGIKRGDYLICRVAKLGAGYELIGTHPQKIAGEFLGAADKKFFLKTEKLSTRVVREHYSRIEQGARKSTEEMKKRILDGGKCVCSLCGRKGKIGGLVRNGETGEFMVLCSACNLKMIAGKEGITERSAADKRKKMFQTIYLFKDIKFKEYFKSKNREDFNFESIEKANKVLQRITKAWNNLSVRERKAFDRKSEKELEEIYRNIKVDFSGL